MNLSKLYSNLIIEPIEKEIKNLKKDINKNIFMTKKNKNILFNKLNNLLIFCYKEYYKLNNK